MLEHLKKLLKHTTIYGFGSILGKVIGFLLIPLYTHYLTPHDYGVLELLDLTISVLGIFVGLGISAAIFRFYYQYTTEEEKTLVVSTALTFVCVVAVLVVSLAIWKAGLISELVFKNANFAYYFRFMFISFLFSTIASVPEAYIMAEQRSALFTTVTIITLTINLSLNIVVVAVLEKGVLGIVFVSALVRCLNTSFWLFYLVPRIKLKFSGQMLGEMLKYGIPLIPANGGLFVITFADRFFLSHLATLSSVGIYSLGYKFGYMISLLLIQPFTRIWQAQLFEIAKKNDSDVVFGKIFTYFVFVLVFGSLGLSVFSKEIVWVVSASGFRDAYKVIPLIAGAFLLRGAYIYFQSGIFIRKQTYIIGLIASAAVPLNLVLNYFLIQEFGHLGAAAAAIATNGFMAGTLLYFSRRVFRIKYEIKRVLRILVVACILVWASLTVDLGCMVYNISLRAFFVLSFPVVLWLSRFYNEAEQKTAKELWRKVRKGSYIPGFFEAHFKRIRR